MNKNKIISDILRQLTVSDLEKLALIIAGPQQTRFFNQWSGLTGELPLKIADGLAPGEEKVLVKSGSFHLALILWIEKSVGRIAAVMGAENSIPIVVKSMKRQAVYKEKDCALLIALIALAED